MEFLKINEKLRWHGYSSIKLCNITQNEAKIKFGQKRVKTLSEGGPVLCNRDGENHRKLTPD